MARRTDFSKTEWTTLHKAVVGAGILVSASDGGLLGALREGRALAKHIADARHKSSSQLVSELAQERARPPRVSSLAELESETLEALSTAVVTLEGKAPDEVEAYRFFVVEVAESVAQASPHPGRIERQVLSVLGTPDAISGEKAILDRIKSALARA